MRSPFSENRSCPAAAIVTGFVPAQIIATFQVYFSNRSLYRAITEIWPAGCGTVSEVWHPDRLQKLTTALFGGLFFTLTSGAGICLMSFSAAWIWDRAGSRKTLFLIPAFILWAAFLSGINRNGFAPFGTLYFTIIPPVVFFLTRKWMPPGNEKRPWRSGLLHMIPIAVLGVLWGSQMEKDLFTDIRDHLLLTHPLGEKIVRFYYRYTVYPAEVLKPLAQKRFRTCNLDGIPAAADRQQVRKALADHHWFQVKHFENTDLFLYGADGELELENGRGAVLKMQKHKFLADPEAGLRQFSSLVDRHRFFRQFTFYSLLMAFPIILYIFIYSFFLFFTGRWASPGNASVLSAALTFSLALILFVWFQHNRHEIPQKKHPPDIGIRIPARRYPAHAGSREHQKRPFFEHLVEGCIDTARIQSGKSVDIKADGRGLSRKTDFR